MATKKRALSLRIYDPKLAMKRDPTWTEISKAIRRLDGSSATNLRLEDNLGNGITVGGGNEGRYYVIAEVGRRLQTLCNPDSDENSSVDIRVAGTTTAIPAHQCVDLGSVLAAAKVFARSGTFNADLTWMPT